MDGTLSLAPALELLKDLFQTGVRLGSSISSSPTCSLTEPWFPHPSERKYAKDPGGLWEAKENISGVWH